MVPVLPLGLAPVTLKGAFDDQVYVTLDVVDPNVTSAVDCPEHIVCGAGVNVTEGAGLTVIVKD